jgi:hypothetical protein
MVEMSQQAQQASNDNVPDFSKAGEAEIIRFCNAEYAEILAAAPDLAAYLDDVDPEVCTRAELIEAFRRAPPENVTIRQVLRNLYTMRMSIATVSGRSFF